MGRHLQPSANECGTDRVQDVEQTKVRGPGGAGQD